MLSGGCGGRKRFEGMLSPSHISRYCVLGHKVIFLLSQNGQKSLLLGAGLCTVSLALLVPTVLCHSPLLEPSPLPLSLSIFFPHPSTSIASSLIIYFIIICWYPCQATVCSTMHFLRCLLFCSALFPLPHSIQVHLQLTFLRLPPISFHRISSTVC